MTISAVAQQKRIEDNGLVSEEAAQSKSFDAVIDSIVRVSVAGPQMSPSAALVAYQRQTLNQELSLQQYSAAMMVKVVLPDTLQQGELELVRHYVAPHTLDFKVLRFAGDEFVKHDLISRMLQSEVDHMRHDRGNLMAINSHNYAIAYKSEATIEGRLVYVYKVRPWRKRVGLFKGSIFIDAATGRLVRTDGILVKSPSFVIRRLEFVQDYIQVGGLTFLGHMHCQVRTRLIGRVLLDTYQHDYQPTVVNNAVVAVQAQPEHLSAIGQF